MTRAANLRRRIATSVLCAGVVVGLVGCGSTDNQFATTSVSDQSRTTEAAAPVTVAAERETPAPSNSCGVFDNAFGGDDPCDELMPDVRCMNLQEAQDEIQDHGVFFSRSEDATGRDRMQLMDRNWVVVRQSPAPGASIGDVTPVLHVVKYGEPGSC